MTDFAIAGHRVRALRHGMAGQPGFELFGPWAEGEDVLGAILAAGRGVRARRAGRQGLLHVEPGVWLDPDGGARDLRAGACGGTGNGSTRHALGSLGGSMDSADIADYYVTPYDIGYGRTVKFDHDFLGREALERVAAGSKARTGSR